MFEINALYGWSKPAKMALLQVKYFREMLIQKNQLANEIVQYNVYILPVFTITKCFLE